MYFLAIIMMGGGTKFLNYVFSQKMQKNIPILGIFHATFKRDG